jgi:polyisoprenoid-binding protein YceI
MTLTGVALTPPLALAEPAKPSASASDPTRFVPAPPPAGAYSEDKAHSSLILRVNHLGFSHFTARFARFDIRLQLDPTHLTTSHVTAHIDPNSLVSDNAPAGFLEMLAGPQWLDTARFPELSYRSTRVEAVGSNTLRIYGELTLHGVTRPVMLNATFNGGYSGHPMDPHGRVGFSAHGSFKRSDFGVNLGLPPPGTQFGVGDEIEVTIETELSGPPYQAS